MMPCGCTAHEARCERGQELLGYVERLYSWLCDPSFLLLSLAVRDEWWRTYEEARRAYFVHIGWDGQEREAVS